ncbi:hypothetical protein [Neorhizobium sp. DT-125]|uniref:hypothetical protein n=1 Tax=Neorhizobium sp. DT-125 TaxID=3396163 RepID=UPI003F1BFCC0
MTGTEEKIKQAALWLAAQTEQQPNVIHTLRQKFDITAVQAAKACTVANSFRGRASVSE